MANPDTEELRWFREQWRRELKTTDDQPLAQPSTTKKDKKEPETGTEFYDAAVKLEKAGHLDEAIKYYRRAFKLDPSLAFEKHAGAHGPRVEHTTHHTPHSLSDNIPSSFFEIDEEEGHHGDGGEMTITRLPAELVRSVFTCLDPTSLERCSMVKKFWFVISREPTLWKGLCMATWDSCTNAHLAHYKSWRRMFLERPRVRYDGLYISKNIYIRPGSTEGTYNQPIHQVLYYRYLRFYPDGTAISTLSFEDPKQVLEWFHPHMDPEILKKKTRHVNCGTFLVDDAESQVKLWLKGYPNHKHYVLLSLASQGSGLHNRLTVLEYASAASDSDEYIPYFTININRYHFVKLPPHKLNPPPVTHETQ